MAKVNNSRLEIKLSDAELDQIKNNAEACGKTVSAYMRETALNMCVLTIDSEPVTKHTSEISAYRNAINQLIFTIKKTGNYTPADLEYILDKTNMMMKSEKEFLNTYSAFIESTKKSIARTVRKIVSKNITK